MSIAIGIPTIDGNIRSECVLSLMATQGILAKMSIEMDVLIVADCPYLPTARNTLIAMFMRDENATDLLFVDSDVGFDASVVPKLISRPEEIVAGIYPLKRDKVGWPVHMKTEDNIPIGCNGLIEADLLPTGFMRIKRTVFEKMMITYPHLQYQDSVCETLGDGTLQQAWDFFHMGIDAERQRWTSEDFAFCQRWTSMGGRLWIEPNITFSHIGRKAFTGNLHEFLMCQSGGCNASQ